MTAVRARVEIWLGMVPDLHSTLQPARPSLSLDGPKSSQTTPRFTFFDYTPLGTVAFVETSSVFQAVSFLLT